MNGIVLCFRMRLHYADRCWAMFVVCSVGCDGFVYGLIDFIDGDVFSLRF